MRMDLQRVRTDITDMLLMHVLLMGTMVRRGLAVGSLLEPVPGSGVVTDTVATVTVTAVPMATGVGMDMVAAMPVMAVVIPATVVAIRPMDVVAMAAVITVATVVVGAVTAAADSTAAVVTVAADGSFVD